jgi:hypothetical protein
MEARLKLCYGMDMTSLSLPHIIHCIYSHGQVNKESNTDKRNRKGKKKEEKKERQMRQVPTHLRAPPPCEIYRRFVT